MARKDNSFFDQMEEKDRYVNVTNNLYEDKQHGSLDYPVGFYHVTKLSNMYLGQVRWHWHRELELMYVMSGRANFLVNDLSFDLSEGGCLFVNTNTLHAVHPIDGYDCEYVSIVFHMNYLFGYAHSKLASLYMLPVTNSQSMRVVDFSSNPKAVTLIRNIIHTNYEKSYAYELITKDYLLQLWLLLLEHHHSLSQTADAYPVNQQISLDETRVKEAITFITQHFAENITLEEIAGSIHISKSECCRCFKRCLGCSPFEYLLKYRIYSSTDLLSNPKNNLSISEIAMQTGFNSSSYYNKIFRKYMGCTPSQFKKQRKEGHDNHALLTHIDIKDF